MEAGAPSFLEVATEGVKATKDNKTQEPQNSRASTTTYYNKTPLEAPLKGPLNPKPYDPQTAANRTGKAAVKDNNRNTDQLAGGKTRQGNREDRQVPFTNSTRRQGTTQKHTVTNSQNQRAQSTGVKNRRWSETASAEVGGKIHPGEERAADRNSPSGGQQSSQAPHGQTVEEAVTLTGVQKIKKRKLEIESNLKGIEQERVRLVARGQQLKRELHVAIHQLQKYAPQEKRIEQQGNTEQAKRTGSEASGRKRKLGEKRGGWQQ